MVLSCEDIQNRDAWPVVASAAEGGHQALTGDEARAANTWQPDGITASLWLGILLLAVMLSFKKLVQPLRTARAASIQIGQRMTLDPELTGPTRAILDRLEKGH